MAIDPSQYQAQGQQYAAGMAASQDPFINLFRNRLGTMKSREQLAQEISGLYAPAIESARRVGTNVANVGMAGLGAITGLASALPGMGVEGLGEAYRSAARAGGSAALLGSTLETGARQALAESILGRQAESEATRMGTEESLAGAESQKALLGADWLNAAQGFQGMGSQYLSDQSTQQQMERTAWEMQNLDPLRLDEMRANIASIQANTELTQEQKNSLIQQTMFEAQLQPGKIQEQQANIAQTKAQTKLIIKEMNSMPKPARARYIANAIANGQITQVMLGNAQIVTAMSQAGYKVKRGKGGKITVIGPNNKEIPFTTPGSII